MGRACALAAAGAGADVVVHYRESRAEAEETAREIRGFGRKAWAMPYDLSDPEGSEPWFREIVEMVGTVQVLINSASIFPQDRWSDVSREDIIANLDVNALAPLSLIRAFASQGVDGAVVNLLDTRVVDRDSEHAGYHLSKRALLTITKDMASELAPGIRVNAVAPGVILPPPGKDETYLETLRGSNPLGAIGTPGQVAGAVLFLLGNDFVTGQVIYVDGGRHLKGNAYGS